MQENNLIIFAKNLQFGKVKTRIASTLGHDEALKIYKCLLERVALICSGLNCSKYLYYSDFPEPTETYFTHSEFVKRVQSGKNLGERMYAAFDEVLQHSAKAVIIGTDCIQLNEKIIEDSFSALDDHDYCIGPSSDGGYYLLGMKELSKEVFEGVTWSSPKVLKQTISNIERSNKSYILLMELRDIDTEEDWNDQKALLT